MTNLRTGSVVASGLLVLIGCNDADPKAGPGLAPVAIGASEFTVGECSSPAPSVHLPVGTIIRGRLYSEDRPTPVVTTVLAATGDDVSTRSTFDPPGETPPYTRARTTVGDLLPVRDEISGVSLRTVTYVTVPLDAVRRLTKGETAQIQARETVVRDGETSSEGFTFTVKLEDCGTLPFNGSLEPVRVYRSVTYRVGPPSDAGAVQEPQRSELLTYVSDRYGWRLRREFPTGVGYEVVDAFENSGL